MPFPLTVGGHTVASPPELAALAQADADGPGGNVVPGQRPWQWIQALVRSGDLEAELAMGLGAALLQNANPVTVAEGARMAEALHPSPLGRLLLLALDAHDAVVLLQVDPARPQFSVEDSLLRSAVVVAPLDDDTIRATVLRRLRNAGLPDLELQVLLVYSGLDEVRTWMPGLLQDGLDEQGLALVQGRAKGGDDVAAWILENVPAAAG